MTSDHGDELGTDRSQRHWRLVSVQAGGGLTVVRQRTRDGRRNSSTWLGSWRNTHAPWRRLETPAWAMTSRRSQRRCGTKLLRSTRELPRRPVVASAGRPAPVEHVCLLASRGN